MLKIKIPDRNTKTYLLENKWTAWIDPNGIVKTKPQGRLVSPRWKYRDCPYGGLQDKEYTEIFKLWENKQPYIYPQD